MQARVRGRSGQVPRPELRTAHVVSGWAPPGLPATATPASLAGARPAPARYGLRGTLSGSARSAAGPPSLNNQLDLRRSPMTYVIAEPCVDVKDQACVSVCPVDCIHFDDGTDRTLYTVSYTHL